MSELFDSLIKQVAESTTKVAGIIDELDAKIEQLSAQRRIIGEAPVSQAEFLAYIADSIDQKTESFGAFMKRELGRMNRSFFSMDSLAVCPQLLTHDASLPVAITEEACLWYLKPAILARLAEQTRGMDFADSAAVPIGERRKMIADIDAQIAKLRADRNELTAQLKELGVRK